MNKPMYVPVINWQGPGWYAPLCIQDEGVEDWSLIAEISDDPYEANEQAKQNRGTPRLFREKTDFTQGIGA